MAGQEKVECPLGARLKQNDSTVLKDVLQAVGPKVELVLKRKFPDLRSEDIEDSLGIAL